ATGAAGRLLGSGEQPSGIGQQAVAVADVRARGGLLHEAGLGEDEEGTAVGTQEAARPFDDLGEDLRTGRRRCHQKTDSLELASPAYEVVVEPRARHDLGEDVEIALVLDDAVDGTAAHGFDGEALGP